jgi:hypothetical protein
VEVRSLPVILDTRTADALKVLGIRSGHVIENAVSIVAKAAFSEDQQRPGDLNLLKVEIKGKLIALV